MRLVIVSQHFWPETMPINHIARSLAAAGVEVCVVTGKPNYPDGAIFPGYRARGVSSETHEGIEIYRLPLIPRGRGGAARLAMNYLSFAVSGVRWGARAVPWPRADAVFVFATSPLIQAWVGIAIARAKGAKLVTWVQDLWPESLGATGFVHAPAPLALVRSAVRAIYRRSDLVLVQSPAMLGAVRGLAGATPVEVFHTPGPPPQASLAEMPTALPPGFTVVFAGNFGAAQALPTILKAASLLCDTLEVRFVLIGSGRMTTRLARRLARDQLSNITMLGRVPASAMPALLARADVLLLTLARDPALAKTIPSKLAEYLSAGKPILVAADGEAARIVAESEAGICVEAENPVCLAAAIRHLHATPASDRAAMGARGRAYFDRALDSRLLIPALVERLRKLSAGKAV